MKDKKMEIEKTKKIFKRIFFICIGILLFVLVVDTATEKKEPKETQETKTTQSAAEVPVLKIPEVFYDGFPRKLNGVFDVRNSTKKEGITMVETFKNFSDEDYLNSLKAVEESDLDFVEIRFRKENTEIIIRKEDRYYCSVYGKMANDGGITKSILYFIVEGDKVLRLNDQQLDEYDNNKSLE